MYIFLQCYYHKIYLNLSSVWFSSSQQGFFCMLLLLSVQQTAPKTVTRKILQSTNENMDINIYTNLHLHLANNRGFSFKRNCVLRRWEVFTLTKG